MIKAANALWLGGAMLFSLPSLSQEVQDSTLDGSFAAMDGFQDFGFESEIPVVLTAARLKQSQLDAPASVTVIEADTIMALGFKDVEEIFRLVPGMVVGYHSGFGEKAPSVAYHGTNAAEHRRLQVLIDGRSVFKPGLARVEWSDIPLAVEDIARIEVIRGPNSAAYGANSYLGIINILTKHPSDEKASTIKVRSGNRGVDDTYVNISSNFGGSDVRWTVGRKNKDGFVLSDGSDNRDFVHSMYTNLRTFTPLGSSASIDFQVGYKRGENGQRPLLDDYLLYLTDEDIDAEDQFASVKLNMEYSSNNFAHINLYSQRFIRRQEWQACLLQPIADFLGEPYYCGTMDKNLDETKTELEYQHTTVWNDQLRTVMGARARLDELNSETYSDGYASNENYSAFANVEYKLSDNWVSNLGGMYETDDLNGDNFSPRIALNHHLTDSQTIRLIYSEAIRSPDIYEMSGQSVYTLRDTVVDGLPSDDWVFPVGQATGELSDERIYSHEISYFALLHEWNAQLDLKLFYDRLTGLITQALDLEDPLTNEVSLIHQGAEGTAKWDVNDKHSLRLTLAYLDTKDKGNYTSDLDADQLIERQKLTRRQSGLSADKSGSLLWVGQLAPKWKMAAAYYHLENWNPYGSDVSFRRLDFNTQYDWTLQSGQTVMLQATVQHRIDDDYLLYSRNNYEDDTHFYITAQVKY